MAKVQQRYVRYFAQLLNEMRQNMEK